MTKLRRYAEGVTSPIFPKFVPGKASVFFQTIFDIKLALKVVRPFLQLAADPSRDGNESMPHLSATA